MNSKLVARAHEEDEEGEEKEELVLQFVFSTFSKDIRIVKVDTIVHGLLETSKNISMFLEHRP